MTLPEHELMLALKSANVLLELDLGSGKELTLPKSVQRDPIRGTIEHVDLIVVKRGEKVVVEVALHVTGQPVDGGVIDIVAPRPHRRGRGDLDPASDHRRPRQVPTPGTQVHAGDLVLPAGTALQIEPDVLVAHVLSPQVEAEPEVEAERPRATRLPTRPRRPPTRPDPLPTGSGNAHREETYDVPQQTPGSWSGSATPGPATSATATTSGFQVLDLLADRVGGRFKSHKGRAEVVEARFDGERVVLAKPRSYMNESGGPVSPVRDFFDVPTEHDRRRP